MFAKNLRYLRRINDMDQLELAHELGRKSTSTISEWEKGKYTPKAGILADIANIFHVKLDALMNVDLSESSSNGKDILYVYNKLNKERQDKTYSFAKNQLEEQENKIIRPAFTKVDLQRDQYIELYGVTSAGIGEDMVEEHMEKVPYNGYVPDDYDYALKVNGDSMQPLFDNGEIIFVNKKATARSGQIIIADINGCSYVKKLKVEEDKIYLVSLNKKYDPIEVMDYDDFRVDGVVVL